MYINSLAKNMSHHDRGSLEVNCTMFSNCSQYNPPITGLYSLDSEIYLPQSFSSQDVAGLLGIAVVIAVMLLVRIIAKSCNLTLPLNVRSKRSANRSEDVTGMRQCELLELESTLKKLSNVAEDVPDTIPFELQPLNSAKKTDNSA